MTDAITTSDDIVERRKPNLLGHHFRVEPVTDQEFNLMVGVLEYDLVGAMVNGETRAEFVEGAFKRLFADPGRTHVAQRLAFFQLIDEAKITVEDL